MNPLVYHIASGQSFFTGIALMLAGAILSQWPQRTCHRIAVLLMIVAALAIVLSSTAISYWFYVLAIAGSLPWVLSGFRQDWQHWAPHCLMAGWLFAAAAEVPYHALPTLRPVSSRSVTVLGDSMTAGVGGSDKAETWPKLLAREHQLTVQNISHVGETAASALKRVKQQGVDAELVLIEIGGNDLLGSTTAAEFDRDLQALLANLAAPNRQLVMFELPLPPFYHEYGRVQRAAAARHQVALVPKRVLLSILAGGDSTLDTIHLSQAGHQRMADTAWGLLQPAFASE
ncbi:SGNH/GDSL hydrolase family protein [Anatilimnocola sp. NA78]|uniref:SGNH/GDSL hydrolase family protein n=1 Tax=Anatilimnocola sp. NA78 TaxID=3415683 RepID=UPI003CE48A52